jgi:tRNA A-37 threonylcarbamoyl transferase component Bud32
VRQPDAEPAALSAAFEAWERGEVPGRELADDGRRRLVRIESPAGALVVKLFRPDRAHPVLGRLKRLVGRSPAQKERRALDALHAAGVPVPQRVPLPAAERGAAERLATRHLEGAPLLEALPGDPGARRRLLEEVGGAVRRLHAAGFAHRDLHAGNVWVSDDRAVLLDLQRAGPGGRGARDRDLAWLDYSLWRRLSCPERLLLRAAALGLKRPFDAAARARLRAVGGAAERRAEQHARSRTRRCLRAGRRFARASHRGLAGFRLRDLDAERLARILDAHAEALNRGDLRVLKDDGRSRISAISDGSLRAVIKESPARSPGRALADALRGSAGRRAWLGGHGLEARGIGAARPLAYLERRRLGLPVTSLVVLEDLRPAEPADTSTLEPSAVVLACGRLAQALHRRGVDHGDLKASHIYVRAHADGIATGLLDLDGVRFHGRLTEARRLRALAQLNASLPDAFPDAARRTAFRRYAGALPFRSGSRAALQRVVTLSLARDHRWSGSTCPLATAKRDVPA